MKTGKPSWTAEITAIYRAVESMRPPDQRICFDPFAKEFLRPSFRLILKSRLLTRFAIWMAVERRFPGGVDTILARIRQMDECLAAQVEQGVSQVVLLGAGFDARAYRFAGLLAGRPVFEVDHPATQALKMRKVQRIFSRLPKQVAYVGVDFEKESFVEKLRRHNFNCSARTFFIWEGVAKYLTPASAERILSAIAGSICQGSSVVFDYLYTSMLKGLHRNKLNRRILAYQEKKHEPFLFGLEKDQEQNYLTSLGFSRVTCITPQQLKQKYFQGAPRGAKMHRQWGIAHAVV